LSVGTVEKPVTIKQLGSRSATARGGCNGNAHRMDSNFPVAKADGALVEKEEREELEAAASFVLEMFSRAKSLIRLLFVCRV
jgi:hypothetical protein